LSGEGDAGDAIMAGIKSSQVLFIILLIISIISVIWSQGRLDTLSGLAPGYINLVVADPNKYSEMINVTNGMTIDTDRSIVVVLGANQTSYGYLNITKQDGNPQSDVPSGKSAAKFIVIESNLNISNATITYTYTASEVSALDENTLRLYKFSDALNDWVLLSGGVNTVAKEVSGFTTSFSSFAIFGTPRSGAVAAGAAAAAVAGAGGAQGKVEEAPIFDVNINLLDGYEAVYPGDYVLLNVRLTNLGEPGRKDVDISYDIIDNNNEESNLGTENVAVETTLEIARKITIPQSLPSGQYTIKATIRLDDFTASSTAALTVKSRLLPAIPTGQFFAASPNVFAAAVLMIAFALGILVVVVHSHVKKDRAVRERIIQFNQYFGRR
jgi:hypothetical protein